MAVFQHTLSLKAQMRLNSALELLEAAEHGFAHRVPF